MEKLLGPQIGGVGSQGVTRARQPVSQVGRDSDMAATHIWLPEVGRDEQRNSTSASTSVWNKAVPPAFSLNPDNSVSSWMSIAPLERLPQRQSSEHVSSSAGKFVHRPFKRTPGTLLALRLTQLQSPLILHPDFVETLFLVLEP